MSSTQSSLSARKPSFAVLLATMTALVACGGPKSKSGAESIGIDFILIPAGEFKMGREIGPGSAGRPDLWEVTIADLDERPVTQVRISSDFFMSKHEVTQRQWEAIMGDNPSRNNSCGPDCPVEQVSWWDVQEFLARLNAAEDIENRYRLPTEAEWEYAARAGTTGDLYGNLDLIAWHSDNSEGQTNPVGQKHPNAFGLYDMIGNTWEWVADRKGDYPGGNVTDPTGPKRSSHGTRRVARGPGISSAPKNCRVSSRLDFDSNYRTDYLGFRIVRTDP